MVKNKRKKGRSCMTRKEALYQWKPVFFALLLCVCVLLPLFCFTCFARQSDALSRRDLERRNSYTNTFTWNYLYNLSDETKAQLGIDLLKKGATGFIIECPFNVFYAGGASAAEDLVTVIDGIKTLLPDRTALLVGIKLKAWGEEALLGLPTDWYSSDEAGINYNYLSLLNTDVQTALGDTLYAIAEACKYDTTITSLTIATSGEDTLLTPTESLDETRANSKKLCVYGAAEAAALADEGLAPIPVVNKNNKLECKAYNVVNKKVVSAIVKILADACNVYEEDPYATEIKVTDQQGFFTPYADANTIIKNEYPGWWQSVRKVAVDFTFVTEGERDVTGKITRATLANLIAAATVEKRYAVTAAVRHDIADMFSPIVEGAMKVAADTGWIYVEGKGWVQTAYWNGNDADKTMKIALNDTDPVDDGGSRGLNPATSFRDVRLVQATYAKTSTPGDGKVDQVYHVTATLNNIDLRAMPTVADYIQKNADRSYQKNSAIRGIAEENLDTQHEYAVVLNLDKEKQPSIGVTNNTQYDIAVTLSVSTLDASEAPMTISATDLNPAAFTSVVPAGCTGMLALSAAVIAEIKETLGDTVLLKVTASVASTEPGAIDASDVAVSLDSVAGLTRAITFTALSTPDTLAAESTVVFSPGAVALTREKKVTIIAYNPTGYSSSTLDLTFMDKTGAVILTEYLSVPPRGAVVLTKSANTCTSVSMHNPASNPLLVACSIDGGTWKTQLSLSNLVHDVNSAAETPVDLKNGLLILTNANSMPETARVTLTAAGGASTSKEFLLDGSGAATFINLSAFRAVLNGALYALLDVEIDGGSSDVSASVFLRDVRLPLPLALPDEEREAVSTLVTANTTLTVTAGTEGTAPFSVSMIGTDPAESASQSGETTDYDPESALLQVKLAVSFS